jgi:hypothetical protein
LSLTDRRPISLWAKKLRRLSIRPGPTRRFGKPTIAAAIEQCEETPMKVMVIVKATMNSEAGAQPSEQLMTEMFKYNEELVKAGIMLAGDGLYPSSKGKRIQFSGTRRTVVDGPFTETKELIAGYWIWQVRSMEEAVEWARRCPNPMPGEDSDLEIRPIIEAQDYDEVFGEALTPDLRAQNERLQAEIERKNKS